MTCHVCGRSRPDAQIAVMSRVASRSREAFHNLRYCEDRGECKVMAEKWAKVKYPTNWRQGLVKVRIR